jgi:hypothetical protein
MQLTVWRRASAAKHCCDEPRAQDLSALPLSASLGLIANALNRHISIYLAVRTGVMPTPFGAGRLLRWPSSNSNFGHRRNPKMAYSRACVFEPSQKLSPFNLKQSKTKRPLDDVRPNSRKIAMKSFYNRWLYGRFGEQLERDGTADSRTLVPHSGSERRRRSETSIITLQIFNDLPDRTDEFHHHSRGIAPAECQVEACYWLSRA